MKNLTLLALISAVSIIGANTYADNHKDTTVSEKVEHAYEKTKDTAKEAYEDGKKGVKKAYRNVKDKTCELVNGKMECVAKKAENKIKNGVDEVKDKANDMVRE